ncbi:MAG: hypothetical protein JXA57_09445 [Armatimonadetes bacterium]|nr:hypothetical protein [Armatimonadota bacterium]
MRTFSEGRLARGIAYLITAAFLWSLGLTGLAAMPASAQVVTRASTSQSVAVVTFANQTKLRPETLGDEAAAAVALELRDRLLLDVLPKQDISLQMRDLGMVAPLSDVELVRLATELDVALMVTGEVRGARIVRTAEGRRGEVVLAVRLFDRMARVDVNGALVTGKGPVIADASDELLIEKALEQAAFTAVEQMKSRPTITAMVLWARGNTVFLNVGTRGGISTKMKMVAIRSGERIAVVEITEADAIGSYGNVVEGPPLRTGDMLRAIFDMPTAARAERHGVPEMKKKRFETIALAAAILLGVGSYASRARRIDEGNTTAPGFLASNLANGAELGYSGYLPSYVEASEPTPDLVPVPASIITWDGYQGGERQRIIAYELVRGGELVTVEMGGGASYLVIDGATTPAFILLEIEVDEADGGVSTWLAESEIWEPDIDEDGVINYTYAEFVEDNSDDLGTIIEDNSVTFGWFTTFGDVASIVPGGIYQYAVAPWYVVQDREGLWVLEAGEFTTSANFVRGVVPAGTFPSHSLFKGITEGVYEDRDIVDNPLFAGTEATFYFYYPYGADEIMLQVATDENFLFLPGATILRNFPVPAVVPSPEARNISSYAVQVTDFPNYVPEAQYYWRIAVRSFVDTHDPRGYGMEDVGLPGWILSRRNLFTARDMYATSRAASMHERRDALNAVRAGRAARVPRNASTSERVFRAD